MNKYNNKKTAQKKSFERIFRLGDQIWKQLLKDYLNSNTKTTSGKTIEHFIHCKRCNWDYDPTDFKNHNCDELTVLIY